MELLALLSGLLLAGSSAGLASTRRDQGHRAVRPGRRARRARSAWPQGKLRVAGTDRPIALRVTGPPVGNLSD